MSLLVDKAEAFARHHHGAIGQKRKYTGEDYITHPAEVAAIVASVTDDQAMIAAAWLHDTVEDAAATLEDIRREFGDDVAALVGELTDVSRTEDGNRATRKEIDRMHTAKASARGKTIKLADLISNSASIIDRKFAAVYIPEKAKLLEVLQDGDAALLEKAAAIVAAWERASMDLVSQDRIAN